MRLSNTALASMGAHQIVIVPKYDRYQLSPGIVHLGLGAFHRAHAAVYTDHAIAAGDQRWGIVGVSLRQADTRDALAPQDNLYTVVVRDGGGERLHVIGALIASLLAPENPHAVLAAMADPRCHVVSLTVTEKGYCHDPATRALRLNHPDIAHDLTHPDVPRSAIGFIVRALALRQKAGLPPFTVLSCDNLPSNGLTTRGLVLAFAAAIDPGLAHWIAEHGAFPNAMVDRIVPKTTEDDRASVAIRLGADDAWPVMTEPFSQWVIENRFVGPRPRWEDAGATIVAEVEPYENAKLRMLNGTHSSLAYLGSVIGYVTVDEAIADTRLANFIAAMMGDEIEPTLSRPGLAVYRAQLLARYRNPALKHKLQQIAMDGSQKLPQRLLGTIRDRLLAGASCDRLCFAVAGWFRYLVGKDESGLAYPISDPLAETLHAAATSSLNAAEQVVALLAVREVFGDDLPRNQQFVFTLTQHLENIGKYGVVEAMSALESKKA
ncbi:mannitol dehydrogenase family protein [Glaciimonas soli]|uniref:Mannitol dehydrogenase family protein n=1 Tax=Glaciimonas soli TaxID=2590999 RepID=A0A843YJB3_9BURK|nr:mannitol dehydrogenase family protein [Glaciimonas soli]MQQ99069.1 mannitol dehydrogenase family protein [Glaciimonas soli]